MIVRRAANALKEQNWTTILIEFVLLVAGVFLGIQAANWNEERTERALVRGHLTEIAQDLRTHETVGLGRVRAGRTRPGGVELPRGAGVPGRRRGTAHRGESGLRAPSRAT